MIVTEFVNEVHVERKAAESRSGEYFNRNKVQKEALVGMVLLLHVQSRGQKRSKMIPFAPVRSWVPLSRVSLHYVMLHVSLAV